MNEQEFHSGLYFRKYKGNNSASLGIELLFDTVQNAAEYVKENYSITEENVSYHIEDTYGNRYAIITNDKIDYV